MRIEVVRMVVEAGGGDKGSDEVFEECPGACAADSRGRLLFMAGGFTLMASLMAMFIPYLEVASRT